MDDLSGLSGEGHVRMAIEERNVNNYFRLQGYLAWEGKGAG